MANPTLTISSESVCFIIVKAREYDVQDVETDPDSGSNATDDNMTSVLEAHPDVPVHGAREREVHHDIGTVLFKD